MSTSPLSSEALVERLFGSVLGMMDVYMVYVGDRLGSTGHSPTAP